MTIKSGNNGNPYHECGPWLVQRRADGMWIGYENHKVVESFGASESAAKEWLELKIKKN